MITYVDGGQIGGIGNNKLFIWDPEEENFVDSGYTSEKKENNGYGVITSHRIKERCWKLL